MRCLGSVAPLALLLLCGGGHALRFYMHDRERRCFQFEAPYGERVLGHRSIANGKGHARLLVQVKSSSGKLLYESHSGDPDEAMFSFVTPAYDDARHHDHYDYDYEQDAHMSMFNACVLLSLHDTMHTHHATRAVTFWVKVDNRHSLTPSGGRATSEGVTRMTAALRAMHNTLKSLLMDLAALQLRERRLVKHTAATAQTLNMFAVVSLTVLLAASCLQVLHYKRLFTAKKLM